jgi:hypothetical protein
LLTSLADLLALSRRELIALVAMFIATLPAVTPRIYSSDEIQYVSYLRSLWFDRDVSFENEYRYFYDRNIGRGENFHATFLELQTEAGRRPNFGTIGSALLWAPFYAAADLVARGMRRAGLEVAVDGLSSPYLTAIACGSAFYGFAAVLLSIAAARRISHAGTRASPENRVHSPDPMARPSLIAGLAVWFGTPLLFYMYVAPPYAHACSAFAVALFVTVWLHVRGAWTPRGAIALGLSGALMGMVREQDVFFAIGPAVDFLTTAAARRRPQSALVAAAGCLALAAGLAPQLLAYSSLNGRPGPSALVVRKMSWHAPHALDVLLSTAHGFFFWTPLAVPAIAGLLLLWLRGTGGGYQRIGAILLLMTAAQIYVSGSVESWTVAGAFGQRRFVALTILLTIGLATLLRSLPGGIVWRSLASAVVILGVWWNLALTALFGTGLMDRQRLELQRNAYDAFVTIPRLAPHLARRYFTTRDSFYQAHESGDVKVP